MSDRNQWLPSFAHNQAQTDVVFALEELRMFSVAASSRFGRIAMPANNGPMKDPLQTHSTSSGVIPNPAGGNHIFLPAAFFFSYQSSWKFFVLILHLLLHPLYPSFFVEFSLELFPVTSIVPPLRSITRV